MPTPAETKHDPSSNVGDDPEEPIIQPTEEPAQAAAEEPKDDHQEKVQQVKHSDFKRIKEEARAKGKAEALSELDEAAKAVGFASHADALKALAELKKTPPAQPAAPTPTPKETPKMPTPKMRADKDRERAEAEARRQADEQARALERKRWRAEERRRRELQAQLDAKDAEMGLREEMYRAGVADVDYTLRLLTRELEGKTEEEIAAFDRSAFYGKLRSDRPYLFGEKVAPATTGTNGVTPDGGTPAEPKPGESAKDAAASQQFDARSAKPADVQARLRALGLNPHM